MKSNLVKSIPWNRYSDFGGSQKVADYKAVEILT